MERTPPPPLIGTTTTNRDRHIGSSSSSSSSRRRRRLDGGFFLPDGRIFFTGIEYFWGNWVDDQFLLDQTINHLIGVVETSDTTNLYRTVSFFAIPKNEVIETEVVPRESDLPHKHRLA